MLAGEEAGTVANHAQIGLGGADQREAFAVVGALEHALVAADVEHALFGVVLGAAAVAVGAALAELGAETQVLVVTHLAQVAAPAGTQLLVSKDISRHVTLTSVAQVDGEARIAEIARMLAGDDSAAAREHARELLSR